MNPTLALCLGPSFRFFTALFLGLWTPHHLLIAQPLSASVSLSLYQPQHPVLLGQETPMLRISLELEEGAQPVSLREVIVATKGIADLEDIRSLGLYLGDSLKVFSPLQRMDMAQEPTPLVAFRGDVRLAPGKNHVWLACELATDADIDDPLPLSVHSVLLSDGSTLRPTQRLEPLRRGVALLQAGQNGVHTYRIPGLATTNEGSLIAVYDIRRNSSVDLQGDIDIGMSRSTDGGRHWEPMRIIMDRGSWGGRPETENGVGDPAILVDRKTGTIWVAGLWLHGHADERAWFASGQGLEPEETGQFLLVKSEDDGLRWSDPLNITPQIKQKDWRLLLQGPGKGICMKDGTLVFPAQFKDKDEVPHSTIIYSKDHGQTWEIGTGAKTHTTEAQVVELNDGFLMLNMRDDRGRTAPEGGRRSVAITRDLGRSWEEHPTSGKALVEPVCMGSLISTHYKGQDWLLFANPAVPKGPRRRLTLKASSDQGMSWPEQHHFLLNADNSYGYSCLSMIDSETVGILYEGLGGLYFQRIRMEELVED